MLGKSAQCLERSPEVIVATFGGLHEPVPIEFGVVWDDNSPVGAEQRVVFNDYQSRGTSCYGLPYPVVVAVDVDAQKVDFTLATTVTNKVVDVFAGKRIAKPGDPLWFIIHL